MPNPEYNLTMKEMAAELRPRERLLSVGAQALSTAELLALIIGTGTVGQSALGLAQQVLSDPGAQRFLLEGPVQELAQMRGIGKAKAVRIAAAVELGRRLAAGRGEERPRISCPGDVANLEMAGMRFLDREHFVILALDTKNGIIGRHTVSIGHLNASLVHPREVFKFAVKQSAAAIIVLHNHPSGDPTPSEEDVEVTKRLAQAGDIMGIKLLDHLVFGDGQYVSCKEKGLMLDSGLSQ